MKVVDLTNNRTGEICNCIANHRTFYSYYVRWHNGDVDVWNTVKNKIKFKKIDNKPNGFIDASDLRWINNGCTVRATETKPQKRWSDPHSSISSISLSYRATLLRAALQGDAAAEKKLLREVAEEVRSHASSNRENLQDKHLTLTDLAFYPYIYSPDDLRGHTGKESASQLSVSLATYKRLWKPRIEAIRENWCKKYFNEIKK